MSRLRSALAAVMKMGSAGSTMVDMVAHALAHAEDVRLAERSDIDPGIVHVQAQDPLGRVILVHAHRQHHELLVELLDAWREHRERVAMATRPVCGRCKGSERVWVRSESEEARSYFESYGIRVLRMKEPLVEIACPCECHEEVVDL